MKVMCIDDRFISRHNGEKTLVNPQVGEIVTVTCTKDNGFYVLQEYPTNGFGDTAWNPTKFIPLSDIDETELVKERETELVNQ